MYYTCMCLINGFGVSVHRDLAREVFGEDTGPKASGVKVEKQQTLHLQQCSVVLHTNSILLANATLNGIYIPVIPTVPYDMTLNTSLCWYGFDNGALHDYVQS